MSTSASAGEETGLATAMAGDQSAQGQAAEAGLGLGKEVNGIKIGEPQPNYDVFDSVGYSHQWFIRKEIEEVPHAQCLVCLYEKENRAQAAENSNSRRKKSDCLKVLGGSTKRKSKDSFIYNSINCFSF